MQREQPERDGGVPPRQVTELVEQDDLARTASLEERHREQQRGADEPADARRGELTGHANAWLVEPEVAGEHRDLAG